MTDSTNAKLRELRERVVLRSQAYHKMSDVVVAAEFSLRDNGELHTPTLTL